MPDPTNSLNALVMAREPTETRFLSKRLGRIVARALNDWFTWRRIAQSPRKSGDEALVAGTKAAAFAAIRGARGELSKFGVVEPQDLLHAFTTRFEKRAKDGVFKYRQRSQKVIFDAPEHVHEDDAAEAGHTNSVETRRGAPRPISPRAPRPWEQSASGGKSKAKKRLLNRNPGVVEPPLRWDDEVRDPQPFTNTDENVHVRRYKKQAERVGNAKAFQSTPTATRFAPIADVGNAQWQSMDLLDQTLQALAEAIRHHR